MIAPMRIAYASVAHPKQACSRQPSHTSFRMALSERLGLVHWTLLDSPIISTKVHEDALSMLSNHRLRYKQQRQTLQSQRMRLGKIPEEEAGGEGVVAGAAMGLAGGAGMARAKRRRNSRSARTLSAPQHASLQPCSTPLSQTCRQRFTRMSGIPSGSMKLP